MFDLKYNLEFFSEVKDATFIIGGICILIICIAILNFY